MDQHMYFDFTSPCNEQSKKKKQTFQIGNSGLYGKYYVYNAILLTYNVENKRI